ncbi:MAG: rubrerythrin [Ruminococcaceae bacterium]|nr:rubrerythrin [Oscillospiraceae bacterium]
MDSQDKKAFIGFQQGELNAVLMYRKFAEITKNPEWRELYLEAAKDEGRHAAILSKYTGETLQPKEFQANLLGFLYRIMPKKIVHFGVSKGEYAGGNGYRPYVGDKYPEISKMMEDEYRHGDIFKAL